MLQIGAFRAWILKQIRDISNNYNRSYLNGYKQAMKEVAQYMDFPLDEEAWKRW